MKLPLVLAITSGKGGVGKTNISANLAYALAQKGKRVLLLDADLGLANVDVVLGLAPEYNLFHLFHGDIALSKIIHPTRYGFSILPASSGVGEMLNLSTGQKLELLEAMDGLESDLDYLIVDTGAGINDNVIYFNLAAQERAVVLTPEPTSLTDAYAMVKVMNQNHGVQHFKVLVNMAPDRKTALEVYKRLYNATDHFLAGVSLDFAGFIPRDPAVRNAVVHQRPFCEAAPGGPACKAIYELAATVGKWEVQQQLDGNIKFFWKQLLFQGQEHNAQA